MAKYYLYFLLFLVSCAPVRYSYAQITVTMKNQSTTASSFSNGFSGFTMSQDKLYLFMLFSYDDAATPAKATITTSSVTFTEVLSITGQSTATPRSRLTIYRAQSATDIASATLNWQFAATAEATAFALYEIGGVASGDNGAAAIVQSVSSASDGISNPSLTLSDLSGPQNMVFAFLFSNNNPFAGTAEAGWVEAWDAGRAVTPALGTYITYSTGDKSIQVTAASSNYMMAGFEFKSAARRIYNVGQP